MPATYRYVYSSFWEDDLIQGITPEDKYFYLYAITNPHTNQCGIYTITRRTMAFETGYNQETIDKLLKRFADFKRIYYNTESSELFVVNWLKYNGTKSPKIADRITTELQKVKTLTYKKSAISICLILGYPIDTVSLGYTDLVTNIDKDIDIELDIDKEDIDRVSIGYQELAKENTKESTGVFALPEWIKKELWDSFLEVRKKLKAPPTDKAIELLVKELEKLRQGGDDPNEVLNQSIMRGWRGVFPLKRIQGNTHRGNEHGTDKGYSEPQATIEELQRSIR